MDIGATGFVNLSVETLVDLGRKTLSSGEVDALILHGLGRPGMGREKTYAGRKFFLGNFGGNWGESFGNWRRRKRVK